MHTSAMPSFEPIELMEKQTYSEYNPLHRLESRRSKGAEHKTASLWLVVHLSLLPG